MTHRVDWCIIGNGKQISIPIPSARLTFGFNSRNLEAPFNVNVCNRYQSGIEKVIDVKGPSEAFELQLLFRQTALQLEKQLGCWPSLGLVVTYTGSSLGLKVSARCMNLLPPLTRSKHLHSRKASPSCYHNWLAERRLITTFMNQLDWPEFYLSPSEKQSFTPFMDSPLELLLSLRNTPKHASQAIIDHLQNCSFSQWRLAMQKVDAKTINEIDLLFMLSRTQYETSNWWLYDQKYSELMDVIYVRLAAAQELL